ncbi:MAG: hypothetical protein IK092_04485, partial [Muribaculaceae bacterium]|nr:hypothetical protein [Muribaculaceae bacterium]
KDKDSPTNLQFIIDAFKKKPKKEPTKFDIKVHNIVIRNSLLTYDVESETPVEGKFDPNHVEIKDLRGDFELPILKNEHFKIGVKRMSFNEKSGFQLKNLVAEALITDTLTKISKLKLQLPNSLISPDNIELHYSKLSNIATELPHRNLKIGLNNNKITPSDFAAFYPQLKSLSKTFNLNLKAQGNQSHIDVSQFQLTSTDNALYTKFHGSIDNVADKANMSLSIPDIELVAQQGELLPLLDLAPQASPKVKEFLTNCGNINLKGSASGSARSIDIDADIKTLLGNVNVNGNVSKEPSTGNMKFDGHVQTPLLDIGKLLSNNKLGEIAIDSDVQAVINNNSLAQSTLDGVIDFVDFNGARYHNITAHVSQNKNQYEGELSVDDPKGVVDIKGNAILNGKDTQIDLLAQIDKLRLSQLNVDIPTHGADVLSMNLVAHLTGNNLDNATGSVEINDLDLVNSKGKRINLNNLTLNADNSSTPQVINVHSPILNGYVKGKFDFKSVASSVKNIMANTFPDVYPKPSTITGSKNNFDYYFVIKPDDRLSEMVNLPVKLIHDAEINGTWNEVDNDISCDINLPYLLQGKNKIIEGTSLHAQADVNGLIQLNLHTLVPAKNEKIAVNIASTATNNNLNTDVAWRYDRVRDYHGNVNTTAHLKRDNNNNLAVNIDVNPTQVIANDTAWQIHPGQINYAQGILDIDSIHVTCN